MTEKVWIYKEKSCRIEMTQELEPAGIGTNKKIHKYVCKIWVDGKSWPRGRIENGSPIPLEDIVERVQRDIDTRLNNQNT